MKTSLCIPAILGSVRLGCSAKERKKPQKVNLRIGIDFKIPPKALRSDLLKDTPCYAEMTKSVQAIFTQREYQTIESLCFDCHQALIKYLKKFPFLKESKLSTTLTKLAPPVLEIVGGSVFTIEDTL